jgi:putative sigma-54 modulation protein
VEEITITGRQIEVPQNAEEYIRKKITKLDKYGEKVTSTHVILSFQRGKYKTEITISGNGFTFHGKSQGADILTSIDDGINKIVKQLKKFREKRAERKKRKGKEVKLGFKVVSSIEEEPFTYDVVKTQRISAKPMSLDEALMQMHLSGEDFIVFTNSETDKINVIYTRKDGTYGIIESS